MGITMEIDDIITKASTERLYKHVLANEAIRHPLVSPDRLDQSAEYIQSELERYGIRTNKQEFRIAGFDRVFYNIEGIIGADTKPELLITSHYDTVDRSPGADDNNSAIAVMLETARVLAEIDWSGNARFVSFSLEEGNPARASKLKDLAIKLGIKDDQGRFTSWHTAQLIKQFNKAWRKIAGINPAEAMAKARTQFQDNISPKELEYLKALEHLSEDVTLTSWPGQTALMGSSYWVDEAQRLEKQVLGVLNLEMVGYISQSENSQHYPKGIPENLFTVHGTDTSLTIGDFLAVVGDKNSAQLATSFCHQCQRDSINLPYTCLQGEFSYDQIAYLMRDILRSDHAPFWRAGIPALLLTDSAEFRNPYYHTPADKINTLDFDFMLQVCKATIATTIDLASSG
jgi:hypothetical protein